MSKTNSYINSIYSFGREVDKFISGKLFFTGLHDVPTDYIGHSGEYLVVNDIEDSVHFTGIEKIAQDLTDFGFTSEGGASDFTGLADTPVDYINRDGDYLVVNDGGTGIHFTGIEKIAQDLTDFGFASEGGASDFTGLADTPSEYTNQAGKYVRVSEQEDALEFIASSELLGLGTVDGYDFCADFQLQSNTTNNSTSFQDLSVNPSSISASNVKHSTIVTPVFGSSSLLFDGDGRLSIGQNTTFKSLSSKLISNYTVQLWIHPIIGSTNQPLMGTAGQSSDHGFRLILRDDNKLEFNVFKGLSNDVSFSLVSSVAVSISNWSHVAIVNDDNVLTFYINGTARGSATWINEGSQITPSFPLQLGGLALSTAAISYFNGYMQDIRIDRTAFNSQYFPPTELSNSECNANQSELTFSSLRDTPVNYTNSAGKYVRVSENESDLEFVGITIAGSTNNQFSNTYLTEDITSDQAINQFNFGGLDIGKTYRISSTIALNADNANDFPKVDFYNGNRKIVSLFSKGSTSTVSNSMLFIARDTTVFASGRDLSSTAYIMGDPEISFVQLELPPTVAVELDEEVLPPALPAGGIFSVGDIKSQAIIADYHTHDINLNSFLDPDLVTIGDIKLNTYIQQSATGVQTIPSNIDDQLSPLNALYIQDIKLNTYIQESATGVQIETADIDGGLSPLNELYIADIKLQANIQEHTTVNAEIDSVIPSFGVLNINDIKVNAIIGDKFRTDETNTFPTGAFNWETI